MQINKIISTAMVLVITLVFVFLFVLPKYHKSQELVLKVAEKQAEYNGKSEYYGKIASLADQIKERQEPLQKIDSALPEEVSLSSLVYFFQSKAAETALSPKAISFSQISSGTRVIQEDSGQKEAESSKPQKIMREVTFTLDLMGNYQGLKNFIASLEKSARLFEIESVSFASLPSEQGQKTATSRIYNFKIVAKTHTY